jgi:hypothetical protein
MPRPEAVRYVMEQWKQDDVSPEIVEARVTTLKAIKEAEALAKGRR